MTSYPNRGSSRAFKAAAYGILAAASLFASHNAMAKDFGPYGKVTAGVRYRYEYVDDEARERHANANTARLTLGYQTPEWQNLFGYVEVESVRHLGATKFDDGLNGKTDYARVLDPQMNDIAQLYVNYTPTEYSKVRIGRQNFFLDNRRFVEYSRSRQNDTSHDAAFFQYGWNEKSRLTYIYSRQFNRYSGPRSTAGRYEGNMNLLNAHYDWDFGIGTSAYAYYLDFTGVPAEENLSSKTHGVRLTWEPKGDDFLPVAGAEFARQSDFGNSTLSYSENYYSGELGVRKKDIKLVAMYEVLGGDGTNAMQTPIGSGHGFNGWADKFSTIPANGLRDIKVNLIVPYALPWEGQKLELVGQLHHYTSDDGDIDYGKEGNIQLTYTPWTDHSFAVKYSDYHANEFSSDTKKLLMTYEYKF